MNLHDPELRSSQRSLATPIALPGPSHVAILLAVHNGARWLPEQLQSLRDQSHKDWSLLVGDDGSTDDSADQVHRFARAHPDIPVRFLEGRNMGFQANFMRLLPKVPDQAHFAAFCDQDDVWATDKLQAATQAIGAYPADTPVLYCGRTIVADESLNTLCISPRMRRAPSFENALVQSIAGGNTMVMNRAAATLLHTAHDPENLPTSHDWWAYQIVAGAGGHVIFDETPRVVYRQHDKNQVGSGHGWTAKLSRLRRLVRGDFKGFNDANLRALNSARAVLLDENQRKVAAFETARNMSLVRRLRHFSKLGLIRQTRSGSLALWMAIALKRV